MPRQQDKHLYNSKRWKDLRRRKLSSKRYCECPHCKGKFIPGEVVDHIKPHRGDTRLFFDYSNLQTLAKDCHDSMKQSEERGGKGFNKGSDARGNPLGDAEHWK